MNCSSRADSLPRKRPTRHVLVGDFILIDAIVQMIISLAKKKLCFFALLCRTQQVQKPPVRVPQGSVSARALGAVAAMAPVGGIYQCTESGDLGDVVMPKLTYGEILVADVGTGGGRIRGSITSSEHTSTLQAITTREVICRALSIM